MQRRYCNPRKPPPEPPKGTPYTSINPQHLPVYLYPARPTSYTSLTHPACRQPPRGAPHRGHHLRVVLLSELRTLADAVTATPPPTTIRACNIWVVVDATVDINLTTRLADLPLHRALKCGLTTQALGLWMALRGMHPLDALHIVKEESHRCTYSNGGADTHAKYQYTNHTPELKHVRLDNQHHSNLQHLPLIPSANKPRTGYPRRCRKQPETDSTTTPRPSNSWPPHWATQRTPNSCDASKTPSVHPSTTQPYAWTASQHTYKNPESSSPLSGFPSSPDNTDGTHSAQSKSPQGTPNASVATQKKKPGTISGRAPCNEGSTPSQTGTQPTPSRSTPDGRHGPLQPNNSPPSSISRRYPRRSAGGSSPLPSTPCYALTWTTPRPWQRTCNKQQSPRQENNSHTAPTNTCSMQPPCPRRTRPTSSNSCSTNGENPPRDIPPNTRPLPRARTPSTK